MRNQVLVLLVCLLAAVGACGEGTAGPAPDPADATSCEELADKYAEVTAEMVEAIGNRTLEEMDPMPEELYDLGEPYFATSNEIGIRTADLCEEGEFIELGCARLTSIEPAGEAGQEFLDNAKPPEGCP
jgi:hypothetical protein